MNRIACPSCGHGLKYTDEQAGKKAKCPKCGNRFELTILSVEKSDAATAKEPEVASANVSKEGSTAVAASEKKSIWTDPLGGDKVLGGCMAIGIGVALLTSCIGFTITTIRTGKENARREKIAENLEVQFADHVKGYLLLNGKNPPEALEHARSNQKRAIVRSNKVHPELNGKIIILDTKEEKIDRIIFGGIRDDLRATRPEEVAYVVWVMRSSDVAGKYSDGSWGYYRTAFVIIIDRAASEIIAQGSFKGGDPPKTAIGGGDRYGSDPYDDIIDYLNK